MRFFHQIFANARSLNRNSSLSIASRSFSKLLSHSEPYYLLLHLLSSQIHWISTINCFFLSFFVFFFSNFFRLILQAIFRHCVWYRRCHSSRRNSRRQFSQGSQKIIRRLRYIYICICDLGFRWCLFLLNKYVYSALRGVYGVCFLMS